MSNTKTVNVEYRSPEDGKMYAGDFTFKRLTIGEIAKVGVETARLNGDQANVDPGTDYINTVLATLKACVVPPVPVWFSNPEALYEVKLIQLVHKRYMEFESSFRVDEPEQAEGVPKASEVAPQG